MKKFISKSTSKIPTYIAKYGGKTLDHNVKTQANKTVEKKIVICVEKMF